MKCPPPRITCSLGCELWVLSVILIGGVACAPKLASAQEDLKQGITGHVYDSETGEPVAVAEVIVTHDSTQAITSAVTDDAGHFTVETDTVGSFSISVERLGYASGVSATVELSHDEVLEIEVVVTPDAVEIPGLVVNQRMLVARLRNEGYYQRKRLGHGAFIEPTAQDLRFRTRIDEMIRRRAYGVRIEDDVAFARRSRGRPCPLKVILDGSDTNSIRLDARLQLAAKRVQAIEVYWSEHTVPAQWRQAVRNGVRTASGNVEPVCGVILIWLR